MMEKNTDRLFWTLTSIIVGALLLTISAKAFPQVTSSIVKPISGIVKQEDKAGNGADDAANSAFGTSYTLDSNGSNNSHKTDDDAQAKANAVEASTLGFTVTNNGDGTGSITKYDTAKGSNVNIPKYVKVNGDLVKITNIGFQAFYNTQLTSVNIPNTITDINDYAFQNNQLTSVNIPDSVQNIGDDAFQGNMISTLSLPKYISNIGTNAFANNNLTSINIPSSITKINFGAFQSNQLTSVNIPNSVTYIGKYAFNQNNLTSVNIPNSVTSIDSYAFQYNQLTSVNIPNSVTYIGASAFYSLKNNLSSVNVPTTTQMKDPYTFGFNVTINRTN